MGVEAGRRHEGRRGRLRLHHPIEPEGPDLPSQVAPADGVPAAGPENHPVGVELALGDPFRRPVAKSQAPPLSRGGAEGEHRGGLGRRARGRGIQVQVEGLLDGSHLVSDGLRQDAVDLGQRALDGGRRRRQSRPPGAHQPQRDGQGLLLREHQRRQLEAAPEPVAPMAAAFSADRDAELLEHGHVAPDGALINLQPLRQLHAGEQAASLEQLQQRQQPGCRGGHEYRTDPSLIRS